MWREATGAVVEIFIHMCRTVERADEDELRY